MKFFAGSSLLLILGVTAVIYISSAADAPKGDVAVQIDSVDADKKAAVVKAVCDITKLEPDDAKEVVDRAPWIVKDQVAQEEADKVKKQLEAAGAKVSLQKVSAGPAGLKFVDMKEGAGDKAKAGDNVEVHYTGWLRTGKKFDSSVDRNEPFEFPLGGRRVIRGWDEGVAGMKVGGKRRLIIPPELGYGERGAGNVIPPNAVLVFEVQLLKIKK